MNVLRNPFISHVYDTFRRNYAITDTHARLMTQRHREFLERVPKLPPVRAIDGITDEPVHSWFS